MIGGGPSTGGFGPTLPNRTHNVHSPAEPKTVRQGLYQTTGMPKQRLRPGKTRTEWGWDDDAIGHGKQESNGKSIYLPWTECGNVHVRTMCGR